MTFGGSTFGGAPVAAQQTDTPKSSVGTPFNYTKGIAPKVRIGTPFNYTRGIAPDVRIGTPFNYTRGIAPDVRIGTPFNYTRGVAPDVRIGTPFNYTRGVTPDVRIGTPFGYTQLLRVKIGAVRTKGLNIDLPLPAFISTVSTLPNAKTYVGHIIHVIDETGGPVLAFYDGANWLRVTDRVVVS